MFLRSLNLIHKYSIYSVPRDGGGDGGGDVGGGEEGGTGVGGGSPAGTSGTGSVGGEGDVGGGEEGGTGGGGPSGDSGASASGGDTGGDYGGPGSEAGPGGGPSGEGEVGDLGGGAPAGPSTESTGYEGANFSTDTSGLEGFADAPDEGPASFAGATTGLEGFEGPTTGFEGPTTGLEGPTTGLEGFEGPQAGLGPTADPGFANIGGLEDALAGPENQGLADLGPGVVGPGAPVGGLEDALAGPNEIGGQLGQLGGLQDPGTISFTASPDFAPGVTGLEGFESKGGPFGGKEGGRGALADNISAVVGALGKGFGTLGKAAELAAFPYGLFTAIEGLPGLLSPEKEQVSVPPVEYETPPFELDPVNVDLVSSKDFEALTGKTATPATPATPAEVAAVAPAEVAAVSPAETASFAPSETAEVSPAEVAQAANAAQEAAEVAAAQTAVEAAPASVTAAAAPEAVAEAAALEAAEPEAPAETPAFSVAGPFGTSAPFSGVTSNMAGVAMTGTPTGMLGAVGPIGQPAPIDLSEVVVEAVPPIEVTLAPPEPIAPTVEAPNVLTAEVSPETVAAPSQGKAAQGAPAVSQGRDLEGVSTQAPNAGVVGNVANAVMGALFGTPAEAGQKGGAPFQGFQEDKAPQDRGLPGVNPMHTSPVGGRGGEARDAPPRNITTHYTGGPNPFTGQAYDLQSLFNQMNSGGNGYSYAVDRDGKVYEMRAPNITTNSAKDNRGFPSALKAQGRVNNSNSIGISAVAKNEKDLTPAQIEAMKDLVSKLGRIYNIPPSRVFGHGQVNPGHRAPDEGRTVADWAQGLAQQGLNWDGSPTTQTAQGTRGGAPAQAGRGPGASKAATGSRGRDARDQQALARDPEVRAARDARAKELGMTPGKNGVPDNITSRELDALDKVGKLHNIDPRAIAALIDLESKWGRDTKGRYQGLTQTGPEMGKDRGTKDRAAQIEAYHDWLNYYNVDDKLASRGIDMGKLSVDRQAAILQGFQFSPNALGWLDDFAKGKVDTPVTKTDQADVLEGGKGKGNATIGNMTAYYGSVVGPGLQAARVGTPSPRGAEPSFAWTTAPVSNVEAKGSFAPSEAPTTPYSPVEAAPPYSETATPFSPMGQVEAAPLDQVEAAPLGQTEAAPLGQTEAAPMGQVEAGPVETATPYSPDDAVYSPAPGAVTDLTFDVEGPVEAATPFAPEGKVEAAPVGKAAPFGPLGKATPTALDFKGTGLEGLTTLDEGVPTAVDAPPAEVAGVAPAETPGIAPAETPGVTPGEVQAEVTANIAPAVEAAIADQLGPAAVEAVGPQVAAEIAAALVDALGPKAAAELGPQIAAEISPDFVASKGYEVGDFQGTGLEGFEAAPDEGPTAFEGPTTGLEGFEGPEVEAPVGPTAFEGPTTGLEGLTSPASKGAIQAAGRAAFDALSKDAIGRAAPADRGKTQDFFNALTGKEKDDLISGRVGLKDMIAAKNNITVGLLETFATKDQLAGIAKGQQEIDAIGRDVAGLAKGARDAAKDLAAPLGPATAYTVETPGLPPADVPAVTVEAPVEKDESKFGAPAPYSFEGDPNAPFGLNALGPTGAPAPAEVAAPEPGVPATPAPATPAAPPDEPYTPAAPPVTDMPFVVEDPQTLAPIDEARDITGRDYLSVEPTPRRSNIERLANAWPPGTTRPPQRVVPPSQGVPPWNELSAMTAALLNDPNNYFRMR